MVDGKSMRTRVDTTTGGDQMNGRSRGVLLGVSLILVVPVIAIPNVSLAAPVLSGTVPRGEGRTVVVDPQLPTPKTVDGEISDWTGQASRYGGTSLYSHGEFIYQDHLLDAFGAAPFQNVALENAIECAEGDHPLGIDRARGLYGLVLDNSTGAAPLQFAADMLEVRVTADDAQVHLLVRTNLMSEKDRTAALVLADTDPGDEEREVPFKSGITSTRAEFALLLGSGQAKVADLKTGEATQLDPASVVTNHAGYANAIEASVPIELFGGASRSSIDLAVATGTLGDDGDLAALPNLGGAARLANIAFRREPVEPSFECLQGLALAGRTIDEFFTGVDLSNLRSGYSEGYEPGTGYHVRTFKAPEFVSEEYPGRGINREYGVYVPESANPSDALPITTFLHGSSGSTSAVNHIWTSTVPGITRDFGETLGGFVLFPKDRQIRSEKAVFADGAVASSGFFFSESLVELETIWDDAIETFSVNEDRQLLTGYSMGGVSTYLLPALMPDRFAGAHVTAGMILDGKEYPSLSYGLNVPWDHLDALKVFENYLHVPLSIFAGATDHFAPYEENIDPVLRLHELGYRYRFYTHPYDHVLPGVIDEWGEPVRYLSGVERDENPARVVHVRDMQLERAVEVGMYKEKDANPAVDFSFDSSFWVSDLTPPDLREGHAVIDVRSLAISEPEYQVVPEAGGPASVGQTGPYVMEGLAWAETGPGPQTKNGFSASVKGTESVRLALAWMNIDIGQNLTGEIIADNDFLLRLDGGWQRPPCVFLDGQRMKSHLTRGVLEVPIPKDEHDLEVTPKCNSGVAAESSGGRHAGGRDVSGTANARSAANGAEVLGLSGSLASTGAQVFTFVTGSALLILLGSLLFVGKPAARRFGARRPY